MAPVALPKVSGSNRSRPSRRPALLQSVPELVEPATEDGFDAPPASTSTTDHKGLPNKLSDCKAGPRPPTSTTAWNSACVVNPSARMTAPSSSSSSRSSSNPRGGRPLACRVCHIQFRSLQHFAEHRRALCREFLPAGPARGDTPANAIIIRSSSCAAASVLPAILVTKEASASPPPRSSLLTGIAPSCPSAASKRRGASNGTRAGAKAPKRGRTVLAASAAQNCHSPVATRQPVKDSTTEAWHIQWALKQLVQLPMPLQILDSFFSSLSSLEPHPNTVHSDYPPPFAASCPQSPSVSGSSASEGSCMSSDGGKGGSFLMLSPIMGPVGNTLGSPPPTGSASLLVLQSASESSESEVLQRAMDSAGCSSPSSLKDTMGALETSKQGALAYSNWRKVPELFQKLHLLMGELRQQVQREAVSGQSLEGSLEINQMRECLGELVDVLKQQSQLVRVKLKQDNLMMKSQVCFAAATSTPCGDEHEVSVQGGCLWPSRTEDNRSSLALLKREQDECDSTGIPASTAEVGQIDLKLHL